MIKILLTITSIILLVSCTKNIKTNLNDNVQIKRDSEISKEIFKYVESYSKKVNIDSLRDNKFLNDEYVRSLEIILDTLNHASVHIRSEKVGKVFLKKMDSIQQEIFNRDYKLKHQH